MAAAPPTKRRPSASPEPTEAVATGAGLSGVGPGPTGSLDPPDPSGPGGGLTGGLGVVSASAMRAALISLSVVTQSWFIRRPTRFRSSTAAAPEIPRPM